VERLAKLAVSIEAPDPSLYGLTLPDADVAPLSDKG
jgi:hypothetical protein